MARISKKLKAANEAVDRARMYPLTEAVKLVKGNATSKFDETIEIAMNLGVDPRHADQMVRGVVAMPNGTGKTMRVAVFAKDAKADEAKAAGADLVGADDLAEAMQNGESAFDRVIATPDMMGVVGRLGKVLGPRGLMPNPKLGTVTPDVAARWQRPKLVRCSTVPKKPVWFTLVSARLVLTKVRLLKTQPLLSKRCVMPAHPGLRVSI